MLDRTLPAIQNLKHLVVLMMENRSFDHMLGALHAQNPAIDGLTGNETNPDTTGAPVTVAPNAAVPGAARPRSRPPLPRRRSADLRRGDHGPESQPRAQHAGLREELLQPAARPRALPRDPELLHGEPVAGADDPGHAIRGLQPVVLVHPRPDAVQPRLRALRHLVRPGQHGRLLLEQAVQEHLRTDCGDQPTPPASTTTTSPARRWKWSTFCRTSLRCSGASRIFRTRAAAISCPTIASSSPTTPTTTHQTAPASSSHATSTPIMTSAQANSLSLPSTRPFAAIRISGLTPRCSSSTTSMAARTITSLRPPARPDGFVAQPSATGTPDPFHFDRLGVRVPAILVSPWIAPGSVINDVFEHASIPATATDYLHRRTIRSAPRAR